jgi:hypothetical protein
MTIGGDDGSVRTLADFTMRTVDQSLPINCHQAEEGEDAEIGNQDEKSTHLRRHPVWSSRRIWLISPNYRPITMNNERSRISDGYITVSPRLHHYRYDTRRNLNSGDLTPGLIMALISMHSVYLRIASLTEFGISILSVYYSRIMDVLLLAHLSSDQVSSDP